MQDVARLAGVSVKTVSNVVNDYPHISPKTRAKVEKAIGQLGYEPNLTARNLRRGRTGLIGLALPELKLPYFAELADSVIVEAESRGLRVLIEQTNSERSREIDVLHGSVRHLLDGLIFSPLALAQDDVRQLRVDYPLVVLGERVFDYGNDHVTMSNVEAARAATTHLIEQGRTRIALIGGHAGEVVGSAALRERGYVEAIIRAGLPIDQALIRETGLWHRETGAEAMRELIASGVEFDAVFAMNDAMAIGCLHALHEAGLRIPQDVAVIGFDDIEDAAFTSPTLSTISPGRQQIAEQAVALLHRRIEARAKGEEDADQFVRVDADFELIVRESSVGRPHREASASRSRPASQVEASSRAPGPNSRPTAG